MSRQGAAAAVLLTTVAAVALWPAGLEAAGPHSFPHAAHLSEAVVRSGLAVAAGRRAAVPGDDAACRTCHDYARGAERHLEGCSDCHQGDAHLAVERAPAVPAGRRPFPHAAHLRDATLTCFSCHPMRRDADWVAFGLPVPGLGPGSGGTAGCADCHAAHEPQGGRVPHDERTGDGRACGECHPPGREIVPRRYRPATSRPGGVRPFRHADHGGAGAACEDCHAGVRGSRTVWDYDASRDTAARCNACHVADAAGTPLVGVGDPPRTTTVPAMDFDRFSHAAHLSPAGELETTGEVTAGCRTCHYPATDPRATELFPARAARDEPVSRRELLDYRTCVPCHADWTVTRHGEGEWTCFRCHTPTSDAEGRLASLRVPVIRAELGPVAFGVHRHPGVTTSGPELADPSQPDGKTCEDCHVAKRETLLSRIQGREFDHTVHVPPDATAKACAGCHSGVAGAARSADVSRFDPAAIAGPAAAEGARACTDCHLGARPEDLAPRRVERTVPEFDHRAHTGTATLPGAAPGIRCTTCHVPGGEHGLHVPADVADCTRCHSHDEARPEQRARTGAAVSADEARRCVRCHGPAAGVVETVPPVRGGVRVHLDLLPGTQWHDRTGDCAVCHERDRLAGRPPSYRERIRSARVVSGIHTDPALAGAWFNDPRIREPGGDPEGRGRTCLTCHSDQPPAYLRELAR